MTEREQLTARLGYLRTRLTALQRDAEDGFNDSIADVIAQIHAHEQRIPVVRVGIAGEVSAGKSTFLNQVLGCNILPVGMGSVTPVPTYISYKNSPMFRAEFHFVSQSNVEVELAEFSSLQQDRETTSKVFKNLRAKLTLLFKVEGLKIGADYAALEAVDFQAPVLNLEENVGGETDISALDRAHRLVDLAGGKPLIVESKDPERIAQIMKTILKDVNLAAVLLRVDISGPFLNLPPDVVLVDTPGLGDSKAFKSARTMNAVKTFDEIWVLTQMSSLLVKEPEQELIQEAHGCNIPIRVIVSHADTLEETEKTTIRQIMKTNLIEHLIVEPDVFDTEVQAMPLTDEDRGVIQNMVDRVTIEAVFWKRPNVDMAAQWLQHHGEVIRGRVRDVTADLREIENNAFLEREESLLPPDIAQNLIDAFDAAFNDCNVSDDQIGELGNLVYGHCLQRWQHDRRTSVAVMRNVPHRRGVFPESKHGYIDIMRDLAQMWAMLMRRRGETLLDEVASALRRAQEALNLGADDDAITRRVMRRCNRIQEQCVHMFDELLTACVRDGVQRFMQDNAFFWNGSWHYRATNGVGYPDQNQVTNITSDLVTHFRDGWTQLRDQLTTSRLTAARVHDTLTPDLRARLMAILAAVVNVIDVGGAIPVEFLCPISLEIMEDPVRMNPCGHIFDRLSIEEWLRDHDTCPICRAAMSFLKADGSENFVRDYGLMWRIADYHDRHHPGAVNVEVAADEAIEHAVDWWNVAWNAIFIARTAAPLTEEKNDGADEAKGPH